MATIFRAATGKSNCACSTGKTLSFTSTVRTNPRASSPASSRVSIEWNGAMLFPTLDAANDTSTTPPQSTTPSRLPLFARYCTKRINFLLATVYVRNC
jgi:hypothetical protein